MIGDGHSSPSPKTQERSLGLARERLDRGVRAIVAAMIISVGVVVG
jgi:hypothetical protein